MAGEFKEINRIKQRRFLRHFARMGSISGAADAVGISSSSHYNWLQLDPKYAEAYELAKEMAADQLEEIGLERAKKGSDLLMIFFLKALRPDKYREQKMIMGGDPNSPVQHEMRISVVRTDDRENYLPPQKALGPATDSD